MEVRLVTKTEDMGLCPRFAERGITPHLFVRRGFTCNHSRCYYYYYYYYYYCDRILKWEVQAPKVPLICISFLPSDWIGCDVPTKHRGVVVR